jgi:hypothetical protein
MDAIEAQPMSQYVRQGFLRIELYIMLGTVDL